MKFKTILFYSIFIIFILTFLNSISVYSKKSIKQRSNPIKPDKESILKGKKIFFKYCIGCHGKRADGRGQQALNLLPRPQNLRNTPFIDYLSDERIYTSISGGVRGTSMPPFEMMMDSKDRWHTINYIRSITNKNSKNIKNSIKKDTINPDIKNPLTPLPTVLSKGKQMYQKYCMSCHGINMDGKGETAKNLIPRPRNLVVISSWGAKPFINYLSDFRLFDSIANGVAGTSMSPWNSVLDKVTIWSIITYLRSEAKKEKTNYDQSFKE